MKHARAIAFVVTFVAATYVSAEKTGASSKEGASGDTYIFHGIVQSTDLGARTLTIKTDKGSFAFGVTPKTKIVRNPNAFLRQEGVALERVKVGELVEVAMRLGSDRKGIAILVNLGSRSRELEQVALFTGKTASGETVSGAALQKLVVDTPTDPSFSTTIDYSSSRQGIFLLSVRPDGTVSNVEVLYSTGYSELDEKNKKWFLKWRFQPNSVVQVRVPSGFTQLGFK
jgi:TonB family protein